VRLLTFEPLLNPVPLFPMAMDGKCYSTTLARPVTTSVVHDNNCTTSRPLVGAIRGATSLGGILALGEELHGP
jgi:hypothetical protein